MFLRFAAICHIFALWVEQQSKNWTFDLLIDEEIRQKAVLWTTSGSADQLHLCPRKRALFDSKYSFIKAESAL